MNFNDWFLSLPSERQAVLREDKWMLANAAFEAGIETERKRTINAIDSLKRADYRSSNIFRHYYPSANGDWVCLRELHNVLTPNAINHEN